MALLPKSAGKSLMVSAFQGSMREFGHPITDEQLIQVKLLRDATGRKEFAKDKYPGCVYFNPGVNFDGWFGYVDMEEQAIGMMDIHEIVDPTKQLAMEVDHSSGHLKHSDGSLNALDMGAKMGGAQPKLRETVMTEGCIGNQPGLCLHVGDKQSMVFTEHCNPPFYYPNCPKYDRPMTAAERITYDKKEIAKSKAKAKKLEMANMNATPVVSDLNSTFEVVPPVIVVIDPYIVKGYVGQAKGWQVVLYERGKLLQDANGKNLMVSRDKYMPLAIARLELAHQSEEPFIPPDPKFNGPQVLADCPDFANEKSALQKLVESRGHILLIGVKCHPEIAGCGVEYSWGKSKYHYRGHHTVNKGDFKKEMQDSLSLEVLPLERIWKYDSRAQSYRTMYLELAESIERGEIIQDEITWDLLEKMRKTSKTHRNIGEQERAFIQDH